ncbi:MAG: hypothetical protein ACTTI3_06710 [Treponema sp.]
MERAKASPPSRSGIRRASATNSSQLTQEKQERLIALLRQAGKKGISRWKIRSTFDIPSEALARFLARSYWLPIGEDTRLDDRIYWVGN